MIMKTKKQFRTLVNLKLLMVMPAIAAIMVSFSFSSQNKNAEAQSGQETPLPPKNPTMAGGDSIWVYVDEMPVYPGGDEALLKYVSEHTTYPEVAKKNKIQGKVIVRFCVTSKGSIGQVSILKSADSELDKEAIRVIKTLPLFEPAKQAGKPVSVWYMLPVTFTIK
jgi:periplasmic protein TonB